MTYREDLCVGFVRGKGRGMRGMGRRVANAVADWNSKASAVV